MGGLEYIESLIRAHSDDNLPITATQEPLFQLHFSNFLSEHNKYDHIPFLNFFFISDCVGCSPYCYKSNPEYYSEFSDFPFDSFRTLELKMYPNIFDDILKLKILHYIHSQFGSDIPVSNPHCSSQIYVCLNTAVYLFHYDEGILVKNNYTYSDDDIKKIIKKFKEIMNYYLLSFKIKKYENCEKLNIILPVQCIERNEIEHLFNNDGFNMNNIEDINHYLKLYLPETFVDISSYSELFPGKAGPYKSEESFLKFNKYYTRYKYNLAGRIMFNLGGVTELLISFKPIETIGSLEFLSIIPNSANKHHITKNELNTAKEICIRCSNNFSDFLINIFYEMDPDDSNRRDFFNDNYHEIFHDFFQYIESLDIAL